MVGFMTYIDIMYIAIIAQKREEEIEIYQNKVAIFYQNCHY